MKKHETRSKAEALREKAEELMKKKSVHSSLPISEVELLRLSHELEVHQLELELQEEELRNALAFAEIANDKYTGLYDFAPSGYFSLSREGEIVELNLAGALMLGKDRSHLRNCSFDIFVSPGTRQNFTLFLEEAFKTNKKAACKVTLATSGNQPVYLLLSGIAAESGKQCFMTAVDITELWQMELALKQSEAKYRQLAESSTTIVYRLLLKPELKFDYVSPSATTITGYTPGDHYNDPQLGFKLVHPDDRVLLENTARYSRGEPLELRWIRKDGRVIWTEQRNVLLLDENNEPYAIEGNARDITDRKIRELGLQKDAERNSLLFALFANAPTLSDKELYDRALDIAVKITDSKIGFFHQVSDDQQEIILTTWNDEAKKNCTVVFDNHYPLEKAGNWAECVRQKEPVVFNNYSLSPNKKGLPEGHAHVGRIMSIPVVHEEKVRLIFGVGNKSSDYTDLDVIQIQAVASELYKILEKRQVEKDLQKSQNRWQFAIEGSNDGIWDWNVLTDDVYFSNRWKEMIGYQPDEIGGKLDEWKKRVHPDDLPMVMEILQQHLNGETPHYVTEHRILCKDGSWKWIIDRGKILEWTSEGKPVRLLGTHSDISERKKAEEVILEDHNTFRVLNEMMSDYIFKLSAQADGSFRMSVIAGNYGKATGHTEDDAGDPDDWYKIIHPEDLPVVRFNLGQIVESKKAVTLTCRSYSADGALRWLEVVASPEIDNRTRKVIAIYGSVRNITERMVMEGELKERETQYRTLANSGIALIWTSGTDKLCNYFNEPWQKFTGRTLEQEMGNGWVKGVHPDDLERCLEIYTTAFDKLEPFEMEYRLRHASGEYRWIRDLGTPAYKNTGDFSGYIGHCFDITQHKLIEEAQSFMLGCGLPGTGEDFFESLARYLSQTLNMEYVCIDRLEGDGLRAQTVAIYNEGRFESNVEYALKDTPCGEVAARNFCLYRNGVRHLFPNDLALQELKAESYIGTTLLDSNGMAIGLIAMIGHNPLHDGGLAELLFKLVGPRAAGELERRQAENALKLSLEQLNKANLYLEKRVEDRTKEILDISNLQKAILQYAGLSIISTSADGLIRVFNDAAVEMLGYTAEEVISRQTPVAFHDPEELALRGRLLAEETGQDLPDGFGLFRNLLMKTSNHTDEWTYIRKGGRKFPVKLSLSSIKDPGGQVVGYIGIASDITEEKSALSALRESEERFYKMFRDHSAVMMLVDPETGKILEANKSAEEFYGFAFNNGPGLLISDINTLSPVQVKAEMDNAMRQHRNYFVFPHKIATGEIRTVEVHSSPIDVKGAKVLFSVIHDITDRQEMEIALKMQSAAFESFALTIIITDIHGRIKWVNPAFTRLTGYTVDEALGKMPGELVKSGRQNKEFYKTLWDTILNKGVWKGELINCRKDGTLYYEEETITPVLDSLGNISAFIAIKIDITERKQAEEEIRKAKNEAEKANLAKSEFLSRMSHELRTPMNSILGFAQLMQMGELNPKQKKGVSHILDNGKHLLDLINEVLDIARIESGREILTLEPIQLSGIINETTDRIQVVANKRKVMVEFVDSPANTLFALADKLRLTQVLLNLYTNAIKYNYEGGSVTIKTGLQPADEQGNTRVRISISDTGQGINPEDFSKLFQAFERIEADRTETEGTGLGLVVVKKLTEAMGGRVGAESMVGTGSTFWIELPLTEDRKPGSSQTTGELTAKLKVSEQTGTILYIEDNLSNIALVEAIIVEHHPAINLITSVHGKQTVKLAKEHKPGLLLLDLDLPDIKGIEVLEQLLADPHTKSIPVIIISADAMPFQPENLMRAGAIDYLTKPLDVVKFLKVIDMHIKI